MDDSFPLSLTLLLSFFFTLCAIGTFAFVGFVFPTHKLLPKSYYHIHYPNRLAKVYKSLRADIMRMLLIKFFWGKEQNRKKFFDGTRNGLENMIYQTKQSEFGHMGGFLVTALLSFPLAARIDWRAILFITLLNVIGNLYPVIIQRRHRMKIERILRR